MRKPLLQIALDDLDIPTAIKHAEETKESIDIIEVGTILLMAEGKKAVRALKEAFPNKIILADAKIADAGPVFSKMLFEAGADWVTAITCAEISTMKSIQQSAVDYQKTMQIELTGYWTFEQAEAWKKANIQQLVYHRSRDTQAGGGHWSERDVERVEKLLAMGFEVSIAGGIGFATLPLFSHLNLQSVVVGRVIRQASHNQENAARFKAEMNKLWS